MKRRIITILIACFVSGIGLIACLYIASGKINTRKNNFIRLFPPHLIGDPEVLNLNYNSYYIAGLDRNRIYLGNKTAKNLLLLISWDLNDTIYSEIKDPTEKCLSWDGVTVTVDSPNLYIINGVQPSILTTNLSELNLQCYSFNCPKFTAAIPLSTSSYVLRVYSQSKKQFILAKVIPEIDSIKNAPEVLKPQQDGVFSIDGMLHYDPVSKHLVYVYFYRNEFLYLDSNLNLEYTGKTIDTNSVAKIKIAKIDNEGISTFAAPPLTINEKSCAYNGKLFILSKLKANNEEDKYFKDLSDIDIYSLKDGSYQFTVYLPKFKDNEISDFRVYDKMLVAIYDHYVLKFKLNFD